MVISAPRRKSCVAKVVFIDGKIWVLATVKALPEDTMLRGAALGYTARFNFEKENLSGFIVSTMANMRSMLQHEPWKLTKNDHLGAGQAFHAVSSRRRSKIIGGFEDLFLHITPVVRMKEPIKFLDRQSIANTGRKFIDQQIVSDILGDSVNLGGVDFTSRVLSVESELGLELAITLEIYVSKYNTVDDNYWIRPSKEQEQRYRNELMSVIEKAAKQACSELGLKWQTQGVLHPTCAKEG